MSEVGLLYLEQGKNKRRIHSIAISSYMVLMAIALLSHLYLMANGEGIDTIPVLIWSFRLLPAPLAIWLGKLWKDRGFRILIVYLLWFTLRIFIPNPDDLFSAETTESILSALWLFASCYGLGHVLDEKQTKQFLLVCAITWMVGITAMSCVGINAIWTDQTILLGEKGRIGLYDSSDARLNLVYLPTTAGSILSLSAMISAITLICNKNRIVKIFSILSFLILLLAMALTDSRTAIISLSVGISVLFTVIIANILVKQRQNVVSKRKVWVWMIYSVVMIISFICSVYIIMIITPLFNQIKIQGIIPRAYAEQEHISIVHRGFNGGTVLAGRAELYQTVLEHFKNHPIDLLLGESKVSPLKDLKNDYAHCHSLYLQILLESGFFGFLLFVCFSARSLLCGLHQIRLKDQELWIKLLPSLIVSLLVGDLVECFVWLRSSQCIMATTFFICAGILCKRWRLTKGTSLTEEEINEKPTNV